MKITKHLLIASMSLAVGANVMAQRAVDVDSDIAVDADAPATGPSTQQTQPGGEGLTVGGTVEGALETTDEVLAEDNSFMDRYPLQVQQGESYTITLTSSEFDTYLAVLTPDDEVVAQNDDAPGMGLNSQVVFQAPMTGEVHVVANSYAPQATGAYTLRVEQGANAAAPQNNGGGQVNIQQMIANAAAIEAGQTQGQLEGTDPMLPDNSHVDVYELQATAGQTLTVTLTSEQFDTYLFLADAEGEILAENDDAEGMGLNSRVQHSVQADGPVYIITNSYDAGITGPYTVNVQAD
jgi:serine protease Do